MTARQLAADNVIIVHTHARCFAQTVPSHELISLGYVALMEAARLFGEFRKSNPLCEFKAYASQRVKWRMLDAVRRWKPMPQESESTDDCVLCLEPAPNGDEDGYEHAHGLLGRLPDLERSALMLAYGIGRNRPATLQEAAKRLRKPPHVVRSLIQSGIMRLRWDAVRGKA